MTQIFRSGAFLQQCWAVHPLCVTVKRMAEGNTLILACTSCRFIHQLVVSTVVVRASAVIGEPDVSTGPFDSQSGQALLLGCLQAHAAALTLREMDVFEDLALIRCGECRRHYAVTVSAFETHQR
jgi:hypothetical protein